ncbi:MAG: M48 family metallopeptidase [Actinomycetota bacterium]|jgi:heat shock protein HtpX|nr:M48 family metallopeptidase [Actinomycetota bacterium]
MYQHIAANKAKSALAIIIFIIFITLIGFLIGYFLDSRYQTGGNYYALFILIIAFIGAFIGSFAGYFYSDKIVLQMTKSRPILKEEDTKIHYMVEGLAIAAGIPKPKVYVIEERSMNAFATGRNPSNSVIVLTRGLIDNLNDSELKGVISHEMSHIKNYDILLGTILVVFVGMLSILSNILLRSFFFGGSRRRSDSRNGAGGILALVFLIAGIILILLSPLIGTIIRLAVSRSREYLADSNGSLISRYPAGLANALRKISANSEIKDANNAVAHLFISDPVKKDTRTFFTNIFSTHPPIEERIKRLDSMALGVGIK